MRRAGILATSFGIALGLLALVAALLTAVAGPAVRLATSGPLDTAHPLSGARPGAPSVADVLVALAGVGFRTIGGTARYTPGVGLLAVGVAGWWAARLALRADPRMPLGVLLLGLVAPAWILLDAAARALPGQGSETGAALPGTVAVLAGVLIARRGARPLRGPALALLGACAIAGAVWILAGTPVSTAILYAPNSAVEWVAFGLTAPLASSAPLPLRHAGELRLLSAQHGLPWWQAEALIASSLALVLALATLIAGRARSAGRAAAMAAVAVLALACAQALLGYVWDSAETGAPAMGTLVRGLVVLPAVAALIHAVTRRGSRPAALATRLPSGA
jgi:hypothetical protein